MDKTKIFMTNGSLMKVESIAELVVISFGLFESGRFTQVLLDMKF